MVYICWLRFFTTNSETPYKPTPTATVLKWHPRRIPITDFLAEFSVGGWDLYFFISFSPPTVPLPLLFDTTWISLSLSPRLCFSSLGQQIFWALSHSLKCDYCSLKQLIQWCTHVLLLFIQSRASCCFLHVTSSSVLTSNSCPGLHFPLHKINWDHLLWATYCIMFFLHIVSDT